jgi:hypothetical protein
MAATIKRYQEMAGSTNFIFSESHNCRDNPISETGNAASKGKDVTLFANLLYIFPMFRRFGLLKRTAPYIDGYTA